MENKVFIATQGVGTHHKKLSNYNAAPEFYHYTYFIV